jgi:hypothetical protein
MRVLAQAAALACLVYWLLRPPQAFGFKFLRLSRKSILSQLSSIPSAGDHYISVGTKDSIDVLQAQITQLKRDKENKQLELLTTEIAIIQAQKKLSKLQYTFPIAELLDYGYQSRSWGSKATTAAGIKDSSVPPNALFLAMDNFNRELPYLIESLTTKLFSSRATQSKIQNQLKQFKLSNQAIWDREHAEPNAVKAPWVIKAPYIVLCVLLDVLFEGSPISRFYFLETGTTRSHAPHQSPV